MLHCTVNVNVDGLTERPILRTSRSTVHRLTTRVSSLRNCRRYLAISRAIPLGSLMFRWRRSFRTLRRPSFHCCFSSCVLPGLAVPSWTRSFSPTSLKSVCVQGADWTNVSLRPAVARTSNSHAPEMLIRAFGVIARSTC
jgi:hypothetical protein